MSKSTESITKFERSAPSSAEKDSAFSLSAADERITAQSRRIETLKEHKKKLMQQLFPVMEG